MSAPGSELKEILDELKAARQQLEGLEARLADLVAAERAAPLAMEIAPLDLEMERPAPSPAVEPAEEASDTALDALLAEPMAAADAALALGSEPPPSDQDLIGILNSLAAPDQKPVAARVGEAPAPPWDQEKARPAPAPDGADKFELSAAELERLFTPQGRC